MTTNNDLGVSDVIWDLSVFYKDAEDESIQKDIEALVEMAKSFSKKYKGRVKDLSSLELLGAVVELEEMKKKEEIISLFAYLNFATQTDSSEAGALKKKIEEANSQFEKELLFFSLEFASLEEGIAKKLLSDPILSKYKHFLEQVRKYKTHQLSEAEEKLLAELSPVGVSSWIDLFDKIMSKMKFGEDKKSEEEILSEASNSLDRDVRKRATKDITTELEGQLHVLTHIFNTTLANKMTEDRLRQYPNWIESRNMDNEISDNMVNALIEAVTSRYDVVQKYYRLKRKLLRYDELFEYDRYAPLPLKQDSVLSWEKAKKIVLGAYGKFSPQVATITQRFFDEKWIHAPITNGKRGGAFSAPGTLETNPFVLVNYMGKNDDVMTLAHELGHGAHQFMAAKQGYFNSQTPLTMAETASTFGERIVFQSLFEKTDCNEEKLSLLCENIERTLAIVFRQISMNRFEDAIHNERRENGELSSEKFNELWMQTQQKVFGDSVTLTDSYQVWWSYIPHFLHVPGYVYAYAFGELLVTSLYKKFTEEGEKFIPKYLELLASGGKDSPENLLEELGVNLNDPNFWHGGLDLIDEMVSQAEKLAKEMGY